MTGWLVNNESENILYKVAASQFKVLSWHLLGGTEKNHENLSQDSWSLRQDLGPVPLECEAGVKQES
jgi:hypothetical protein